MECGTIWHDARGSGEMEIRGALDEQRGAR